jgi:UDP-N-acetylglucosamine 2-epimerase (non-hydrolysing)
MIDNLFHQLEKLKTMRAEVLDGEGLKGRLNRYGVITLHRPSNVDDGPTLDRLLQAMGVIAAKLPLIFPIHPRTQAAIEKFHLTLPGGIVATKPLAYMPFLNLFKDARLVLTDSGGIQEETTALGVPCLTLRENTERPITAAEGTNVVVGTSRERIISEAEKILTGNGKVGKRPELWDGRAAERIVDVLAQQLV